MEAFFHSEPRIEAWVNQVTENIFAACQLNEVDSEVEFQKGREIVSNLTHLLQGIAIFPVEYLEDGLKQLFEQQLPVSRVIKVPEFQETMNKMLHEGMMRAFDTPTIENLEILATSEEETSDNTKEDARNNAENSRKSAIELSDELVLELAIPALALAKVPEPIDHLKSVLRNMFPNVPVVWNPSLMGRNFLAQVEDILICHQDAEQPCDVENLNNEGWKVFECSSNDLMFPRRLERGIRQIQRLGKQSKKG